MRRRQAFEDAFGVVADLAPTPVFIEYLLQRPQQFGSMGMKKSIPLRKAATDRPHLIWCSNLVRRGMGSKPMNDVRGDGCGFSHVVVALSRSPRLRDIAAHDGPAIGTVRP